MGTTVRKLIFLLHAFLFFSSLTFCQVHLHCDKKSRSAEWNKGCNHAMRLEMEHSVHFFGDNKILSFALLILWVQTASQFLGRSM